MVNARDRVVVVVGGGPAAAAAASAAVEAGWRVTVLDVGRRLDDRREAARRRLAASAPSAWSDGDRAVLAPRLDASGGLAAKQLFGSDLAFDPLDAAHVRAGDGVGARPSFALGGLSNIWGAGVTPYTDADLRGWPIDYADLEEYYVRALSLMPYSAADDDLSRRYPIVREPDGHLFASPSALALLDSLRARRSALEARGLSFGGARLAVRASRPAPERGCIYCGECLNGCVYGHIYSASQTLDVLRGSGRIEYRPGVFVRSVAETSSGAHLELVDLVSRSTERLDAARVFLGAGSLSTTAILQRSDLVPDRVELLDSQALFLPFVDLRRRARPASGHYALAQAFLALEHRSMSHNAHISLYDYDDSMLARARALRPALAAALGPALELALRRMITGIAFLHSDVSGRISVRYEAGSDEIRLDALDAPGRAGALASLRRGLYETLGPRGLVLVGPLVEVAAVGASHHYGGSVPMRHAPERGESDLLGRPSGASRIHLVDASSFPSIPAGTITLPIMANAWRVTSAALAQS